MKTPPFLWCRGEESDFPRRPFQGRALPLSYLGETLAKQKIYKYTPALCLRGYSFLPQKNKKSSRLADKLTLPLQ